MNNFDYSHPQNFAPAMPDYLEHMRQLLYPQQRRAGIPMQQPVQQAPQHRPMVWVDGFQEANSYPVGANEVIPLWDKTRPYVYRREADAAGQPKTRIFQLVEVQTAPPDSNAPVTRPEFEQLIGIVKQMAEVISYQPKYEAKEAVNDG